LITEKISENIDKKEGFLKEHEVFNNYIYNYGYLKS